MDRSITKGDCVVNSFGVRPASRNVNNGGMDFPANLKRLRIAAGLTQEQLAAAMGWSGQSQVSNYENGRGDPPLAELDKLAHTLGVDIAELFNSSGRPKVTASHSGRFNPDMLAESIAALRRVAKNNHLAYDPETHPDVTIYTYELRQALPPTPSTADVIDFGAKLAERLRLRAEGGGGGQGNGGQAGSADRKRAKGRSRKD